MTEAPNKDPDLLLLQMSQLLILRVMITYLLPESIHMCLIYLFVLFFFSQLVYDINLALVSKRSRIEFSDDILSEFSTTFLGF